MRPRIVVLVGLPGSGKSSYVDNKAGVLSSDEIRRLISDDPENQGIHRLVFGVLRSLLKHRLELKRPVTYIDATNLTPAERRPYLRLGEMYGCDVDAVFFDVPVEECQRRNRGRARVVPDEVIQAMSERLVAPSVEEGFHEIRAIR